MKNKKQLLKNRRQKPRSLDINLVMQDFMPFIWLALAVIIVFFQTMQHSLTRLDDAYYLLDHKDYFSSSANILTTFVQSVVAEQYRPVLFMSFITDTVWGRGELWLYHGTNIIFHYACCCMVLVFLRRIAVPEPYPLLLSLVFAIHPLSAQAVAWIPGRSESMMTMFMLASIVAYHSYLQNNRLSGLLFHAATFMAAMLTKETGIITPILCLLINPYLYQRPILQTLRSASLFRLYGAWVLVIVIWWFLRVLALAKTASMAGITTGNIVGLEALWLNLQAIPELIGKMIIPFVNSSLYPRFSLLSTSTGIGALCLILLGGMIQRFSSRTYLVGLIWLLLALLPPLVIRATGIRFDYLEYRAYLPLIGLLLCGADLLRRVPERLFVWIVASLTLTIIVFMIHSYRVVGRYDGEEKFWSAVQQQEPTLAEPYLHLATIHLNQKHPAEAEALLRKAVRYDSSLADAYSKLGNAIYQQRPTQGFLESKGLFERAKILNPKLLDPHINLIIIHIQQQQPGEALRYAHEMQSAGLNLQALRPDVAAVLRQIEQQISGQ